MIITRIELKNWKNFVNVDVECTRRVFLIGPNASGKSNFLDALRFLKDTAQLGLERAVELRGGMKSIRCVNARKHPNVAISVTLDEAWRYSLTFGSDKGRNSPLVMEESVHCFNNGDTREILHRPDRDDQEDPLRLTQTALQQVIANRDFRDIPDFLSTIQYRHILPQLVREPKAFSPAPVSNDPFGRDLVSTIWKTPERTRNARLKKINEALRIAVPYLKNLSVKQNSDGVPHFEANYEYWRPNDVYRSESDFSDGTLRLIALLWSLLDTSGPLLLEEPELSLHEEIVAQLPTLFARLDRDRKKAARQIFVTTHSESMLRDPGIGPGEVLRLEPGAEGVAVLPPTEEEKILMTEGGLSAADVLLPKTRPADIQRLGLF